ncbi:AsnC family transcriptional regulator [Desulfosarcina alkanivorans]|uniref:AsnC family transcriptional regulator n=1 Tax=Desulfosarcina alkanivorans TaxID=571177 RepID=A0A5K7YXJ9_9BACT|nr:GntR family transcriptional regulator [Desulfosarcina alkanivorans]BBO71821.1 AsnC family transcriptional regulator [Desulfosarcina alkanivorans]
MKRGETKSNAVPLSEIAYRQIKSQIVSLTLEPGAQIDETAMADSLGIGRTPIRESLFRLAAEGLLRVRAGRGFFVRDITLDDIKDLFETLMIMERAAVALAARRIGPSGIGRLERLNDQFRRAWQCRQFLDVTLANSHFHRELYAATGNDFMTSYLNSLQTQSQRMAYICFTRPATLDLEAHAEESIRDHHELIARLKRKDESGAVELITGHIRRFREQVADYTAPALLDLGIVA